MNTSEYLPKAYVAGEHEERIYQLWEEQGAFKPSTDTSKPVFSVVMPPANANGNLHVGHALEHAQVDALVRYHRMLGDRTLWIPGTDHAGIETQVVFEKVLEKEGRSRFKMTREQFYDETMAFTLQSQHNIQNQLRSLGSSVDWSVNRFTLDNKVVEQVYDTFRRMYGDGLIYRGERIVNYSVKYQTAYSDLEVEHEERVEPLYYIKYGPITVATVRPETKFGDKTVVVHPDDERYQQYIGTSFMAMTATGEEAEFTVIADDVIKPEFGTGAMTITPAHDPIDFEIAKRHNLPINKVIGLDGRLLPIAGEFAGMKVAEARTKVAEKMQDLGMIVKTEPNYKHTVGLCYKSKQLIEPMLMPQWFIKVKPLAQEAIKAIKNGDVVIHPENYRKILIDWLEGLRDWNISRQITWGIPIAGAMPEVPEVANDTDTFDTWFSSGQWPYAVLKSAGEDYFKDFYPSTVMETGRDLVFLWVPRMIMFGLYVHGAVPFKNVYFHGMVNDKLGKKMSKSKGNVVSPLELAAKYGTDALRFGMVIGSSAGSDMPLPEEKMVGGRNFANKLWNISRFVLMTLGERMPSQLPAAVATTDADKLITQQFSAALATVEQHIAAYRYGPALQEIHEFIWHQFADVYIEAAKKQLDADGKVDGATCALLWQTLLNSLKMAHPFMPFVTEAIWQLLPETPETLLATSAWPKA